jgi:hypothetical protein
MNEDAAVPSTRRSRGSGPARCARWLIALPLIAALAAIAFGPAQALADPSQDLPPNFPNHPTQTPNWPPPNWPPPHGESTPPADPPPANSPPPTQSSSGSGASGGVAGASAASGGYSGVAGKTTTGRVPVPHPTGTVTVPPQTAPVENAPAKHHAKPAHHPKPVLTPIASPQPAAVAETDSRRSTFADRLLSPTQIDLSAKNLGEGGLLALLLVALLYLPVTIFNKATEKNHETIARWFARPRAWFAALFGWIPASRHPFLTLTAGVLASAVLFSFIEPGFPGEDGALQYLIGMAIGFAVVSTVFFASWRLIVHRLEPEHEGHWRIYPPYIVLAAFLVVLARLAHFIPGVVLGTVAEYEPATKLSARTAGIRVATTYGVLMVLGIAAWFAWIPVEHAASREGASSLTLILDSALAITFVSALESVCFGLIPLKFLDGNDLFTWRKGLWAGMWGAALLWFSVVILHPALSTYREHTHGGIFWFAVLFSSLMVVALATWGLFRVRDARAARASAAAS